MISHNHKRVVVAGLFLGGAICASVAWRARRVPERAFGAWGRHGDASGFNLLLVTVDTLRADHLGCYGYREGETPTFDSLSTPGVRFSDAVATVPLTLPSHATILTGLNVLSHGVRHNGEYRLDERHETLAEILKSKGYDTAAFVGAFVLDGMFGLEQGFDVYDDDGFPPAENRSTRWGAEPERRADHVADSALSWLRNRERSGGASPFFLWVHFYDPHSDYRPPSPFGSRFGERPYDGEIAYTDGQLARLLAALDEARLRSRTLVVVLGDHGESLFEHGEPTHGHLLYGSSMRIPFIIHCPSIIKGRYVVDDRVVGTIDVVPTVLDLLGIPQRVPFDGLSLLLAEGNLDRAIYMETLLPQLHHGWSPLYGLRRHRDKFIQAPRPEYYNLVDDSGETKNLYDEQLTVAQELRVELAKRLANAPPLHRSRIEPDSATVEALASLGYVSTLRPKDAADRPDPKDMMPVWQDLIRAKQLSQRDRFDEALKLVRKLSEMIPDDAHLLGTQARISIRQGHIQEAERILRRMLDLKPSAATCIWLGQILVDQQRFGELTEILAMAETLDPDAGGVYVLRGDMAAQQGRFDQAFTYYDQAERVDPKRSSTMARAHAEKVREFMKRIEGGIP